MNDSEILYDVLIFLVAAVVVVPAFQRLRTSPVLGYLAAGILVGPHGLTVIRDSESAHTLAEFGVVFLLFMIGLEFSLERLRSLGRDHGHGPSDQQPSEIVVTLFGDPPETLLATD